MVMPRELGPSRGTMQKHYEPARLALFLELGSELAGMHQPCYWYGVGTNLDPTRLLVLSMGLMFLLFLPPPSP